MEYEEVHPRSEERKQLAQMGWRLAGVYARPSGVTYVFESPPQFEHKLIEGDKRDVAKQLAALGDEGWEAFPVHDASNKPGELTFFLKREKRAKSKEIPSSAGTDAPTIS